MSWDKTRSWYHKLIDADNLTTFFKRFNLILLGNLPVFVTPRTTVGFSIIITCTNGEIYIIEVSGNKSCPGKESEIGKYEVPKYIMNSVKYWLFSIDCSNGEVYF